MIICMGAGDITKWAGGAARGLWRSEGAQMSEIATLPRFAAS